ncbi:hypothetical protein BpHYR1_030033 [Brachionus plicatilis]|uniref:Uncharacterized protein n=1 Tax=Brachionus plicatilis TaxID=10195 RepID=A0A3M7S3J9_BRAPC|nr:hypothetical protein BpHYR1_030033 [Brachionus plicatilis]
MSTVSRDMRQRRLTAQLAKLRRQRLRRLHNVFPQALKLGYPGHILEQPDQIAADQHAVVPLVAQNLDAEVGLALPQLLQGRALGMIRNKAKVGVDCLAH